uniref:Syntaxin N-terminal domain-containing protein n=1 Tax=Lotharella globosa TaxID=91324 RepID=A0A7S3YFM3_9EUKA
MTTEHTPLVTYRTPIEQEIDAQLSVLVSSTSKLKSQTKRLGTSDDTSRFRARLENTRRKAMAAFHQLKQLFKDAPGSGQAMAQLRKRYSSSIGEFLEVTQKAEDTSRRIVQNEQRGRVYSRSQRQSNQLLVFHFFMH